MIIDNESCANVVSATLVMKLCLNIFKHEKPYRLQWLNECGEVRVTKHVLIIFLLESIRMRFYMMWFLYMLLIYCWGILDNLIEKPSMMDLRTNILLKRMKRLFTLYQYHLDMFTKIN
jgi:hypothetical protein